MKFDPIDTGRAGVPMLSGKHEAEMPENLVPIVKTRLLGLWHDYWDSKKPSEKANAEAEKGTLGMTASVEAKNKADAVAKAEHENPGYVAIRGGIERL